MLFCRICRDSLLVISSKLENSKKKQHMHLPQKFPPYQDLVPKKKDKTDSQQQNEVQIEATMQSDFDLALRSQLH